MRIVRIVAFIGACLLAGGTFALPASAAGPAADVNWTQFRFNQNHTGFNPFETVLNAHNVPSLTVAWQAQLGMLVDFSSPAVVDGVVYIGSTDGRLWAYPSTGCGQSLCTSPLWTSVSLAQIVDSPTVANGVVYVGSQTSPSSNDGKLNAFSASGCGASVCSPLWQGLAGTQSILQSSPAVANGRVFVGAFDHKLYVFDANGCGAATCQPLWTGTTGGTIESTPTVAKGVVFIGSDDGKLYAFKAAGCGAATCQPLWTGALGSSPFESSPAVAGGTVYIGSQHALSAFSASGCGGATCGGLRPGSVPGSVDGLRIGRAGGRPLVTHGGKRGRLRGQEHQRSPGMEGRPLRNSRVHEHLERSHRGHDRLFLTDRRQRHRLHRKRGQTLPGEHSRPHLRVPAAVTLGTLSWGETCRRSLGSISGLESPSSGRGTAALPRSPRPPRHRASER